MEMTVNPIFDIYNFIYIAVIILGGVTVTLTLILNAKKKDRQHRAILIFVLAIFFYMIVDFVTFYFLGEFASGSLVFTFITLSDTMFCVLVVAWIYVVMVTAKIEEVISVKSLTIISIAYLVSSQILSVSLGRFSSFALHVEEGVWKMILQLINMSYSIVIILIGIRCLTLIAKKYERSVSRNFNFVMVGLLIGYMLWIVYWDYSTWYVAEERLLDIYAVDPLIMLYAILNVFFIYYFCKTDPLKISENRISPEAAVDMVAKRYELSEREREVLSFVNNGLSNKQIAAELSISENTVKRHMSNIFRKTETQSRHEIICKISQIN